MQVPELNHLQENEETGERPETSNLWEGNILSVIPDGHVAEMVLSKGCETHLLSWFSFWTAVQILHFKKLYPTKNHCAGKLSSIHQVF